MRWLQKLKVAWRLKKKPQKEIRKPFFWGSAPWYKKQSASIVYNVDFLKGEKFSTPRGHAHTAFLMQELLVPKNASDFYLLKKTENFEIGLHQKWLYNWLEMLNTTPQREAIENGYRLIMESIATGSRSINYEKLEADGNIKYGKGAFNVGLLTNKMIMENFRNSNLIIRNVVTNSFEPKANYCEYEGPKHPWPPGNKYFRMYVGEEMVFEYQTVFN